MSCNLRITNLSIGDEFLNADWDLDWSSWAGALNAKVELEFFELV